MQSLLSGLLLGRSFAERERERERERPLFTGGQYEFAIKEAALVFTVVPTATDDHCSHSIHSRPLSLNSNAISRQTMTFSNSTKLSCHLSPLPAKSTFVANCPLLVVISLKCTHVNDFSMAI